MFNKGYYCHSCGPIQTSVKHTRKGEKLNTCPNCGQVVTEWERPLNERDGRRMDNSINRFKSPDFNSCQCFQCFEKGAFKVNI